MNVIDRHILNEHFELTLIDKDLTFDRSAIVDIIDRAKTYLILEKNVKRGEKVILTFGNYYIPWFFACAELGLTFIISASHKIPNYKDLNNRYGTIDHVIIPFDKTDLKQFHESYTDIAIDMNLVNTYHDISKGQEFWVTPTCILTSAISDNYNLNTKNVTPVEHTHDFYFRLMSRNGFKYGIEYHDRCYHNKILHHGSSLGVYFLPTINYSCYHFWCDDTEYYWPKYIIDYNINRCILFEDMIPSFMRRIKKYPHETRNLTIYTLSLHTHKIIDFLINECNATVVSLYGMTATSGPVLWQVTTKDTINGFEPRAFDELDEFYQIDVSTGKMKVQYDNISVDTDDDFIKTDKKYYFLG